MPEDVVRARGTADDPDTPQGRAGADAPREERVDTWRAGPLTDDPVVTAGLWPASFAL